jgi:putative transposase
MSQARKSIKQSFRPNSRLFTVMLDFQHMTNDCIRIGMEFQNKSAMRSVSMKKLSSLCYRELRSRYSCYSAYALCAISKATGILSARRKSIMRGFPTRTPFLSRPMLVSCYGFRIESDNLIVHIEGETFESIPLNAHTRAFLSDEGLRVRSFTVTEESLSLCASKDIKEIAEQDLTGTTGIDRNLRNLAVGNSHKVVYYDMTKIVEIGENTKEIIRSFRRNDVRIRREIASKYGRRRRHRTRQLLNWISKRVVRDAKARRQAIVFEEITGIRRLYGKGNSQGRSFRGRMNSWPFYEIKRQIEYKAAW